MSSLFVMYLVLTGTLSSGLQVARGLVRGAGKLLAGEPRPAASEVVGSLAAPVASACTQARLLVGDACAVAQAISGGDQEAPEPLPHLHRARPRSRIVPAPGPDGAPG
jgi:hypothetical protein